MPETTAVMQLTPSLLDRFYAVSPYWITLFADLGITQFVYHEDPRYSKIVIDVPADCAQQLLDLHKINFDIASEPTDYKFVKVITGTLDDYLARTVHLGRVPCKRFEVGDSFYVDPTTLGPNVPSSVKAVREAKVRIVNKVEFMQKLQFETGETFIFDVAEIKTYGLAWVDAAYREEQNVETP